MAKKPTTNQLTAQVRTESGKGAARRARRAGNVPAVLYGHGTEPQHLLINAHDFAAILRANGTNAIIELDINGDQQLALTKQVDVHPIRSYIEHTDLLIVRKGEKVSVEVTIEVVGSAEAGTLVTQDATTIEVEADALNIPESLTVSVEGAAVGTIVTAAGVILPEGVTLVTDPDAPVVGVHEIAAAPVEDEAAAEGEATEAEAEAPAESSDES
ncbi:50S ribosomal protein L25/general stress protein Ctc [Jongsikchunia kroppenstedtii]|uniref:50S ribosomal protein L25/general stress protein Ctc n=1 Tax=Jongsikchunia kroppenstedtii TaxID=1121721 RepID=UPI00037DB085|nr:50S ribosomal protein L25/general stress protein Ctc [Jongsikchunia kroppenstedtii]